MARHEALVRAGAFCEAYNLRAPILMAPMAGACPASLAIAIANAGGLGGCGALLMQPDAIRGFVAMVRPAEPNSELHVLRDERGLGPATLPAKA